MRIFLIFLLSIQLASSAIYYVDFDGGSDAAAGTSTGTAWKHCRGDANATGTAGTGGLSAGDTVNFKGGVYYYGLISTGAGTLGNQLTYQGDAAVHGWGTGKAIIDGSAALSMTVCSANGTNAGQVPNANFANIYYATKPSSNDWRSPIIENDVLLDLATTSTANPSGFFFGNTDYFTAISSGISATACTDAVAFNQADEYYWNGSRIMYHVAGSVGGNQITSFNPATDTVSYSSGGTPYQDTSWDNKYHYQVANNPRLITRAGQYAIDDYRNLIFVWPLASAAAVRIGSLIGAFDISGNSYVTMNGFVTTGQYGQSYTTGRVIRGSNSTGVNGVVISNCDLKNAGDGAGTQSTGATYLRGGGTTLSITTNCTYKFIHGRGAHITGVLTAVKDCYFENIDGTAVYTQNYSTEENTDGEFSGNTITNCYGVHMNGITVYGATSGSGIAKRWKVTRNKIYGFVQRQGPGGITAQGFNDLEISGNLVEADQGIPIDGPREGSSYIRMFNNTVVVPGDTQGSSSAGWIRVYNLTNNTLLDFRNNICHGLVIADVGSSTGISWPRVAHSYNLYTGLSPSQTAPNGWTLAGTESTNTRAAAFTLASARDYTPKAGGPLLNVGTNLSSFYTTSLNGTTWADPWDIGAYEYQAGGSSTTYLGFSTSGRVQLIGPGRLTQ